MSVDLELGAGYVRLPAHDLYLERRTAARLAYERGTRTIDEVRRELPPPPAELTLVEALDRARAMRLGVGPDQPVPGLDVPASEETAEGVVHRTDSGGGPASPLEVPASSYVPLRRLTGCNAAGSLGRHPIPAGAPASCPCGRVRRYPPA